jgi:hypothetical protein
MVWYMMMCMIDAWLIHVDVHGLVMVLVSV